ncbi:hypothetical protein NSQ26_06555 [Bacillus sp. FSL W7-1360]
MNQTEKNLYTLAEKPTLQLTNYDQVGGLIRKIEQHSGPGMVAKS